MNTKLTLPFHGVSRLLFGLPIVIPALLYSSALFAAVVENGQTLSIDGSTQRDNYVVREASTLNSNGAETDTLSIQTGSVLNMNGGTATGEGGDGIIVTGSTANISGGATITGDFLGLSINRVAGTTIGSTVTLTGSNASGGDAGAQITGLSRLVLNNSTVTGTGASSTGLNIISGDVEANSGTSITGQVNGARFFKDLENVGDNRLVLNNSSLQGLTGAAILVNSSTMPAIINVTNGSTLSGGNGNLLEVRGASTATMTVANSKLVGNVQVQGGSTANLIFNQGQMTGNLNVEAGSNGTLTLNDRSTFTGSLINVNNVALNSQSNWNMTADNTIGALNMDGGRVTMGPDGQFYQLNVGTLEGNGTFAMNVDFALNLHDTLNVTGSATGDHSLLVSSSGRDPLTPEEVTLVKTAAGDAKFSLANGPVDVGTFSYDLSSVSNDDGSTDWFLDPSSKTVSPGTRSILALFNTAPTIWYGELTSLRTRMGELRFNGGQAGGWMRSYGNKYNVSDANGLGYQQNQQGFSLGADAPLPMGDGHWLVGLLVGYSKSDLDLSRGTSGTVKSSYLGGYTTWLDPSSGYYFDGVIKVNHFKNSSNITMSDGARAKGDYSDLGLGGSVEFGRHIKLENDYFIEPFTQLSTVVIQGANYASDNGMKADGDRARSLLGKVGMTAGRNFILDSGKVVQPYLRGAMAHEFVKSNEVSVNGNLFNNDLSGSRAELGAGVAVSMSDRLQLHADFDYSNGEHVEQPFGANVGLRYSW